MRTPEEIEADRRTLEEKLAKLDDEEQEWADLTRAQRIVELDHKGCTKYHSNDVGDCNFRNRTWATAGTTKLTYLNKVENLLMLLPLESTDEEVAEIIRLSRSLR